MRNSLFLILVASACHGGGLARTVPRAGDKNVMLVETVIPMPSRDWFIQSGWYRFEKDLITPARLYVSGLWACVLDTPEVFEPRAGEYYACSKGWRSRKGW